MMSFETITLLLQAGELAVSVSILAAMLYR